MENQKIRTHYGEKIVEAKLPDGWNLLGNLETKAFPRIGPEEVMKALDDPIGTPSLEDLARGKKNAVIVSSDVTRPVQGDVALPILLNRLNLGGIPDGRILLIMGGGSHKQPPDLQKAFVQKFGKEIVDRVRIEYHHPDENLVRVGHTRRGHLIEIYRSPARVQWTWCYTQSSIISLSSLVPIKNAWADTWATH